MSEVIYPIENLWRFDETRWEIIVFQNLDILNLALQLTGCWNKASALKQVSVRNTGSGH